MTEDQPEIDTAGIELPLLRTPLPLGDPADAPPSGEVDVLSPETRYGPPPDHVRAAWARLSVEKGRKPTTREMQQDVGGNNQARAAWCRMLAAEDRQARPEPEAVAACRAALAARTQQYGAWVETCQEAQAEVERSPPPGATWNTPASPVMRSALTT